MNKTRLSFLGGYLALPKASRWRAVAQDGTHEKTPKHRISVVLTATDTGTSFDGAPLRTVTEKEVAA